MIDNLTCSTRTSPSWSRTNKRSLIKYQTKKIQNWTSTSSSSPTPISFKCILINLDHSGWTTLPRRILHSFNVDIMRKKKKKDSWLSMEKVRTRVSAGGAKNTELTTLRLASNRMRKKYTSLKVIAIFLQGWLYLTPSISKSHIKTSMNTLKLQSIT